MGMPWFIPLQLDKKLEINQEQDCDSDIVQSNEKEVELLRVYGNFCGPCCAKFYLECVDDPELSNKWQCNELLKELFNIIYGVKSEIPKAENPKKMRKYCGPNGITEYQYAEINEKKIKNILKH
jgi:hypothetical protein